METGDQETPENETPHVKEVTVRDRAASTVEATGMAHAPSIVVVTEMAPVASVIATAMAPVDSVTAIVMVPVVSVTVIVMVPVASATVIVRVPVVSETVIAMVDAVDSAAGTVRLTWAAGDAAQPSVTTKTEARGGI